MIFSVLLFTQALYVMRHWQTTNDPMGQGPTDWLGYHGRAETPPEKDQVRKDEVRKKTKGPFTLSDSESQTENFL